MPKAMVVRILVFKHMRTRYVQCREVSTQQNSLLSQLQTQKVVKDRYYPQYMEQVDSGGRLFDRMYAKDKAKLHKLVSQHVDEIDWDYRQTYRNTVWMGSFTSTPRIEGDDEQDDDVVVADSLSRSDLMALCQKELTAIPPNVHRTFHNVTPTLHKPDYGTTVRVMQWNVLSQALGVTTDNFVYCPDDALRWSTRRYRMLEEIITYLPDIICLQEVDHFSFLDRYLSTQGFTGKFFPKPDSPCVYIADNNGPDGCAIFYNTDKYELVSNHSRVIEVWRVESNQVVMMTNLRNKETGQEICIATTHLKARSGALLQQLRNEQGKDILTFLHEHRGNRPIICTGDFNAEPSEPVYKTMRHDRSLKLNSAYTFLNKSSNQAKSVLLDESRAKSLGSDEPPYTTWKVREDGEKCQTLDYMFYTPISQDGCLQVTSVLNFPSGEDIGEGRIPSYQYASDHFSLVCDFQLS